MLRIKLVMLLLTCSASLRWSRSIQRANTIKRWKELERYLVFLLMKLSWLIICMSSMHIALPLLLKWATIRFSWQGILIFTTQSRLERYYTTHSSTEAVNSFLKRQCLRELSGSSLHTDHMPSLCRSMKEPKKNLQQTFSKTSCS